MHVNVKIVLIVVTWNKPNRVQIGCEFAQAHAEEVRLGQNDHVATLDRFSFCDFSLH